MNQPERFWKTLPHLALRITGTKIIIQSLSPDHSSVPLSDSRGCALQILRGNMTMENGGSFYFLKSWSSTRKTYTVTAKCTVNGTGCLPIAVQPPHLCAHGTLPLCSPSPGPPATTILLCFSTNLRAPGPQIGAIKQCSFSCSNVCKIHPRWRRRQNVLPLGGGLTLGRVRTTSCSRIPLPLWPSAS